MPERILLCSTDDIAAGGALKVEANDLILAVSEKLNLGQAGIKIEDIPAKIVWFKDKLVPKSVLSLLP